MGKWLREYLKKNLALTIIQAVSFSSILVLAIIYKQPPLQILPLFVTLFAMLLQAKVNRYGFLIGGINACIYGVVYITRTLYSSAAYSFLVSCPLQIITFINWDRHTEKKKNVTNLKLMSNKMRLVILLAMILGWGALYVIFSAFGSKYMLLDNAATLISIVCSALCALCYVEYMPFALASRVIAIIMNLSMVPDSPHNWVWVINSAYGLICNLFATATLWKRYIKGSKSEAAPETVQSAQK